MRTHRSDAKPYERLVAWMLPTALSALLLCGGARPAASIAQTAAEPSEIERLAMKQNRMLEKYLELEQLMIRMAELEAATNPQRARLLRRATQLSSERLMRNQLSEAARSLRPPARLNRAVDQQEQAVEDLKALLALLLSENRADRLKSEQQRIRDYIKEVERLIRLQRGAKGRVEGGADLDRVAGDQQQIADRAERLANQIQENEEGDDARPDKKPSAEDSTDKQPSEDKKPGESKPGESKPGESKPGESKPGESKPGESQPGESQPGESKPGESKPGESKPGESKPGESKPGESKPGESQPGESQPGESQSEESDEGHPARRRLQVAERRMREARKRLEDAERNEAIAKQEEARRELEKAKAALEQILRQLREEEVERTLAALESRFRRMYEAQLKVHETTQQLQQLRIEGGGREVDIRANKLSFEEVKLVVEADRALELLREEGSSVAFPEAVSQMRDDMQTVADRLAESKVGIITQATEEDILAALEEMIAAFQQAQQDQQQQRQQRAQGQQPGQPQEQPLVNQLAELKMIRALQVRVQKRTADYAQRLRAPDDPVGAAEDADLRASLRRLSERQARIYRVTHDIVVGKNQ